VISLGEPRFLLIMFMFRCSGRTGSPLACFCGNPRKDFGEVFFLDGIFKKR
jgi:hypothetical protein